MAATRRVVLCQINKSPELCVCLAAFVAAGNNRRLRREEVESSFLPAGPAGSAGEGQKIMQSNSAGDERGAGRY